MSMRFLFLVLLSCASARAQTDFQWVLSPEFELMDPNPDPVARDAFQGFEPHKLLEASMTARSRERMRLLDQDHRLSPDDSVLAVIPSIQLLRVIHDQEAGAIEVITVVLVGSLTFFDPWTGASSTSCTRMVEVASELGKDSRGLARDVIAQTTLKALNQWIKTVLDQADHKVSPFALQLQTLEYPGPKSRKAQYGLVNKGYADGLRRGMLLSGEGAVLRIQAVQDRLALVQNAASGELPVPAGLHYRLVLNQALGGARQLQGKRVHLSFRPAKRPSKDLIEADAALSFMRDYLSQNTSLNVMPISFTSDTYVSAFKRFRDYLNQNSDLVSHGLLNVSLEDQHLLSADERDLEITLAPLSAFSAHVKNDDGFDIGYQRFTIAALVEQVISTATDQQLVFQDLLESEQEVTYSEMKGVLKLDPEGKRLSVQRNALIKLARSCATLCEKLSGSSDRAPQRCSVSESLKPKWQAQPPNPGQPLIWTRPMGEIKDPVTGNSLGRYEQLQITKTGMPLTSHTLQENELKAGDILSFNPLEDPFLLVLMDDPQSFDDAWPWPGWLHKAQLAKAFKATLPKLSLSLNEDAASDTAKLWQSVECEACQLSGSELSINLAWRLSLAIDRDTPSWKAGKLLKKKLSFDKQNPDADRFLWETAREYAQTMATYAKEKQIPIPH